MMVIRTQMLGTAEFIITMVLFIHESITSICIVKFLEFSRVSSHILNHFHKKIGF